MPIVQLQSTKSLTELAQRLYGLAPQDTRLAAAVNALAAANPTLPADLSKLPATTAVVVPAVNGLTLAPGAVSAAPQDVDLVSLVRYVGNASQQIVAAAQSGSPPPAAGRAAMLQRFADTQLALKTTPTTPQPVDATKLQAQLKALTDNVNAFLKLHGG
jgi:cytochrome c556